uniref:Uncharacterized protein n=1 Tax=Panagrolaimus sp. JU765 TaxID=591449 RepID=A0AC34QJ23_9BILA
MKFVILAFCALVVATVAIERGLENNLPRRDNNADIILGSFGKPPKGGHNQQQQQQQDQQQQDQQQDDNPIELDPQQHQDDDDCVSKDGKGGKQNCRPQKGKN